MSPIVLCECRNCIYCLEDKIEKGVYRFRCGADEITVGLSPSFQPLCYTFEGKLKRRQNARDKR